MKTVFRVTFIFVIITIVACNNNDDIYINKNDKLLGTWINPVYVETTTTFDRARELKEDGYGVSFLSNQKFIERHSGWCGTPPLSFSNFEGNWEQSNSIVEITLDNGIIGMNSFSWKIISVNDTTLIVER